MSVLEFQYFTIWGTQKAKISKKPKTAYNLVHSIQTFLNWFNFPPKKKKSKKEKIMNKKWICGKQWRNEPHSKNCINIPNRLDVDVNLKQQELSKPFSHCVMENIKTHVLLSIWASNQVHWTFQFLFPTSMLKQSPILFFCWFQRKPTECIVIFIRIAEDRIRQRTIWCRFQRKTSWCDVMAIIIIIINRI